MTQEQQTLFDVQEQITLLPPVSQKQIQQCVDELHKFLKNNEGYGEMALALIGAEIAAGESPL